MVARDGIEPPTPAFSGLRATTPISLIQNNLNPAQTLEKPAQSATKCNHPARFGLLPSYTIAGRGGIGALADPLPTRHFAETSISAPRMKSSKLTSLEVAVCRLCARIGRVHRSVKRCSRHHAPVCFAGPDQVPRATSQVSPFFRLRDCAVTNGPENQMPGLLRSGRDRPGGWDRMDMPEGLKPIEGFRFLLENKFSW